VITVRRSGSEVTFVADDPGPDEVAYVDAEWLSAAEGLAIPVLTFGDRSFRFSDGAPARVGAEVDPDKVARSLFGAIAAEAAAVVREVGASETEVTGNGLVASDVRALLDGTASLEPESRPDAIVDTTGDPATIARCAARVADFGTIVLAGEQQGRSFDYDFYPDIHVRGLRIVGVPRPLQSASEFDGSIAPETSADPPTRAIFGVPTPERGLWFRVSTVDR
jgi:hypothetical protein